ncbi:hypothetical protein DMB42_00850 [Nonomuraea sp. WAC 01424]|nr:hypothetical protein DMB42_00850 [Nonomuraea sp. WAC 01424]
MDTLHVACTDAIAVGDLPTAISAGRLMMASDLVGDHPCMSAGRLPPSVSAHGLLPACPAGTRRSSTRTGIDSTSWTAAAI